MSTGNATASPSEADSLMATALLAISRASGSTTETISNSQESPTKQCMQSGPMYQSSKVNPSSCSPISSSTEQNSKRATYLSDIPSRLMGDHGTSPKPSSKATSIAPTCGGSGSSIANGPSPRNGGITDLQFQLALQAMTDATSNNNATLLHFLSSTTSPTAASTIEAQLSHLGNLHAPMIPDQLSLQKTYLCTTESPYLGSFPMLQQALKSSNTVQERNAATDEQKYIRQQEIEKALLSKPQRGRKRANLNEVERLELTRTRNREHAKSTRIRKKMRYEELLDCEKKILELEEREDLKYRRRCGVIGLLALRQQMLQEQIRSYNHERSDALQKPVTIVEDISVLIYDGEPSLLENCGTGTFERMKQFDMSLTTKISNILDRDNESTLEDASILYETKSSLPLNDIAIADNDIALVEVDIVRKSENRDRKALLSFLLKIVFASKSEKILSIVMVPIADTYGITSSSPGNCLSFSKLVPEHEQQNLEEQISHPSVVSLDVDKYQRRDMEAQYEKRSESDDVSGLGMPF
jgi:hypothetical protein